MRTKADEETETPGLADTHCHVLAADYPDMSETFERAAAAGVTRMLVAGSDLRTSREAIDVADRYSSFGVHAAAGVHPHEAVHASGRLPDGIRELALHPRVAAVGETGLDYYYDHSPRDMQRSCFLEHVRFAGEIGKPLIIHGRDSYDDLRAILRKETGGAARGVVHCFSGTEEDAADLLDMGLYLSFGGPLTFRRSDAPGAQRYFLAAYDADNSYTQALAHLALLSIHVEAWGTVLAALVALALPLVVLLFRLGRRLALLPEPFGAPPHPARPGVTTHA